MKKILLVLIIFLGFFLRIYRIGQYPVALYGDEIAFAWNSYNILLTGEDEYGTPYPLQFRSFDDYKSPVPVYMLVPFINYLGMNMFAIRLPVVIFSTLTIFFSYLLIKNFLGEKTALISSLLLAVSPWHLHLSRGYFEATEALFFFVVGVYFYVTGRMKFHRLMLSMIFFALTIYTYFTPRIMLLVFIPFLMVWGYFRFPDKVKFNRKKFIRMHLAGMITLLILVLPLLKETFWGPGLSRYRKLSELNSGVIENTVYLERQSSGLPLFWKKIFHNKFTATFSQLTNNYLEHLSINFWYIYGDNSLRYFLGKMGMFYLIEMPFLIIGLLMLLQNKRNVLTFFLGWILIAPIPAALVGRSFALRSLAMLPAPFVFVAFGINETARRLEKIRLLQTAFTIAVTFGLGSSLFLVMVRYYFEYPQYAATWWGWENKAALDFARQRENSYDKIFLSNFYSGMPLALAVYNKYDPRQFRDAIANPVVMADGRRLIKLGKYYIGSLDLDGKRFMEGIIPADSLYIGRPEESGDFKSVILSPSDKRLIYRVFDPKNPPNTP